MLCVVSGFSSPAWTSPAARRSRSSASGARLKSLVLTSWSSSSTPIVNACEFLKSSMTLIGTALFAFAGRDQCVPRCDGADQVQDGDARCDNGREPCAEIRCDVVDRLRHADREP